MTETSSGARIASPGSVHILEDDPGVSDSLRFLLQALGHDVVLHPDAESFFEGPSAVRRRRGDRRSRSAGHRRSSGHPLARPVDAPAARVIAITGQAQKVIEDELRDLPLVRLLRKPLSGDVLVALL